MAYDVSNEYRVIAYSGGAEYDCILKVNGKKIPNEQISSITISSPIIDTTNDTGKVFHIGTFISEQIKIKFKNLNGINFETLPEVKLTIGMLVNGVYEYVPIGTFITDELAENYQQKCEITCLDYAVKFKKEVDISQWFNADGYILAEDLLKKLCNYYGVALGKYPNVNLDKKIYFYDSTLSGKTYISYLAELMGGNAKIDKNNTLQIKSLYEENNGIRKAIDIDVSTAKSLTIGEKYKLSRLVLDNGTNIYQFGGGVVEVEELPTSGIDLDTYYYLTSDMKYYKYDTTNNKFVENTDLKQTLYLRTENFFIEQEKEVENIYNAIKNFEIYNVECENRADLSLESFDTLRLTVDDKEYYTLNDHTVTFKGVAMDKIKVKIPSGKKTQTTNKYNRTKDTESFYLRTMIDEGEASIKTISNKQTKYQQQLSSHEQRIDGLEQTVQEIENLTREATGTKKVTIKDCVVGNLLYFGIKGNNQVFKYLYPSDTLLPSDTLIPYGDSRITITNRKGEIREYDLGILDTLRQNGDKYDEFICDNNQAKVIRRINTDGSIRVNELTEDLGEIVFELFEDENTIEIKNYSADIYVQYAVKSEFTDIFATRVEMNSSIKQTAREISLEVKETIDDNEKLSAIVLTSDGAKIKGESIALEGTVTANENFKILNDGSIEANNGTFKGDIFLGNGRKVIGGDGLLTNLTFSSVGSFQGYSMFGFMNKYNNSNSFYKSDLSLDIYIPKDFTVVSAILTLLITPAKFEGADYDINTGATKKFDITGFPRNLKLYKGYQAYSFYTEFSGEYTMDLGTSLLDEIKKGFGENTYTPKDMQIGGLDIKQSIDFGDVLEEGYQNIIIRTNDNVPNDGDFSTARQKTGLGKAFLNVIGYTNFKEE